MTVPLPSEGAHPLRGFRFDLPSGFIEVPVHDDELSPDSFGELSAKVAGWFALPTDDGNATAMALGLATFGAMAGQDGADYAAVGLYRSPDDPQRPIMVLVTSIGMPSDHDRPATAIAGLLEIHDAAARGMVGTLKLPVGPAVAIVTEEETALRIGEEVTPMLRRQVAAWVPDPDGTTLAVLAVSTTSWQDWEHVCTLAVGIFESLEWDPLAGTGSATLAHLM